MKYAIITFAAFAAVLGAFFMNYDAEARAAELRARIEAIQATAEYKAAEAAQLAKWEATR